MKRRKKYSLHQQVVQQMLELYSGGMPTLCICEEFEIARNTLRRLIREYESINGADSLRTEKMKRGKAIK